MNKPFLESAFTLVQCWMLLTLEALLNDNKHLPQTSYDARHKIRQLAYFRMIHESHLNCLGTWDGTYIKVNVLAADCPTLRTRKGEIATNVLDICAQKGISYMSWPIGKDLQQNYKFSGIPLHDKMDCKCQRDITICGMQVIQTLRDFSHHTEARGSVGNTWWEVVLSHPSVVSHHPSMLPAAQFGKQINDNCEDIHDVDEGESLYATTIAADDFQYIETTNEWSQ
ncbi:retrotransposon protein [Cucumis melo var. makuwa]|uniref:Retrotransposon protein n=1 Tax=Cucumis melo var. makuwa TaxID=1194695 RepID=A0A5A7U0B8_CUCMM|nr:retrotransposon protein [Cucumis melo var. makuwa]